MKTPSYRTGFHKSAGEAVFPKNLLNNLPTAWYISNISVSANISCQNQAKAVLCLRGA